MNSFNHFFIKDFDLHFNKTVSALYGSTNKLSGMRFETSLDSDKKCSVMLQKKFINLRDTTLNIKVKLRVD
jgi:hypothetical protein